MRVTKYDHATLVVQLHHERLLVDPGAFTSPLDELERVAAVVITHEHPDHWTAEHLHRALAVSRGIPIFAPAGVAAAVGDEFDITVVAPGDQIAVGPFTLQFFGGKHATIHSDLPVIDNVGVLINGSLYYPGDSFAVPEGVEVRVLAAPLGAPWLRIADAIDFVRAVGAPRVFGTHDMTLSVIGKDMHRNHLRRVVHPTGGEFLSLEPGDHIEI